MDLSLLLGSSLAFCGGLITAYLSRRTAKKTPKTERRADAYEEVVLRLVSECLDPGARTAVLLDDRSFRDGVARVVLFGESNVVSAMSGFLAKHRSMDGCAAVDGLTVVVREMRKSLMTGYGDPVIEDIRTLLAARVRHGRTDSV